MNMKTKSISLSALALLFAMTVMAQDKTPFEMPRIVEPTFNSYSVDITVYGAVGDGIKMNTEAIQKSIDETSKRGGGRVNIPAGVWLTGPFALNNNVNLHLDKNAVVMFSRNHADFKMREDKKGRAECPIHGSGLKNIAITGEGVFDGSGDTWRPMKKSKYTESQIKEVLKNGATETGDYVWPAGLDTKHDARPYLMEISNCKNVLVDGPTFQNSPMFGIVPRSCENLIIRNVKVLNEWNAQNGDGIDVCNCNHVILKNCFVSVGDDGICMKSSGAKPGGARLQDIWIEDCTVLHAHGGFVCGSNTDGGMHRIYVRNCKFMYTDTGLRFKSARDRGGLVDSIFIDNIFMKDIQNDAITFDTYYENINASGNNKNWDITNLTPHFNGIHINNVTCNGARRALYINGLPEMPVENVYLNNITITAKTAGTETNAKNISKNNVKIIETSK